MAIVKDYVSGSLESTKFERQRPDYREGVETIKELGYEVEDFMQYFPCFTGHLTLARYLSLHDCYQKTLGVAGHIAEVGVFRGGALLFFTKLVQIFEANTLTQVHGFDWFEGNKPSADEDKLVAGADAEPYERLMKLIEAQRLDHIVKVHKMDVTKELDAFFDRYPHLQFKMVFLDAGMYDVVKACLPHFWDRLVKGGILILDQYNFEVAPGETRAVNEFLKDKEIRTFPNGWMPTAYIVK